MAQNLAVRKREITINSNWIITVGMALLFPICGALLIWNIRSLLFERVDHSFSPTYLISAVYYFLFAYSFPAKSLKVAFLLLGTDMVIRVALHYLHASNAVQHAAAVGGSLFNQIALTIILVAIVHWFRSVVHWTRLTEDGAPDH
jgi:hypothetical protein